MRGVLEPRIAAGADGVGRFFDGGNVREHDAVATHIERLLGLPLRHLDPIDGNPGHRRDARHHGGGFGDLRAVEHVLQAIPQEPAVPGLMLHLEDAAVDFRGAHRHGTGDLGRRKTGQRMLSGFKRADDAVEPWKFSHSLLPWYGAHPI